MSAFDRLVREHKSYSPWLEEIEPLLTHHFGVHCRTARAWLGWSQAELARRALVSLATVRRVESKGYRKRTTNLTTLRQLAVVLEEFGAVFIRPNLDFGGGVLFKYVGPEADDIDAHFAREEQFKLLRHKARTRARAAIERRQAERRP